MRPALCQRQRALSHARRAPGPGLWLCRHAPRGGGDRHGRGLRAVLHRPHLDAEQAQAGGLLHERFALDDFERLSQARLQRIAANAPLSLRAAKAAILASMREPSAAELETIAALVRQCFDSADYAEGRRAFAERRDPVFTAR
ncbi:enoyl-CoA hydratase-related protein [Achromobacter xylosoxidans]